MDNSKFNMSIEPLFKADKAIKALTQKPKLLDAIERQNKLFDLATPAHTLMATCSAVSSILSTYPSVLEGSNAGLNAYKYWLDTSAFNPSEHIATIQNALTIASDSLAVYTPKLYDALNISGINAFECETARVLKAAEIHVPFAMSSVQIADTLRAMNSLPSNILPAVDKTLASSRLLTEYRSLVERQHTQIQKDVWNSAKRLKIIEIATDLVQEQIASATQFVENTWNDSAGYPEDIQLDDAKTAIQYIPSYLGYTFREDSSHDLEEEFAKSMISKIMNGGKAISEKLEYIDELCMATGREAIFKPTTKTYRAIHCISTSFSADAATFGCVVDSLYMLIYEGSGEAKRILTVLPDSECSALWNIKHIRTDFRHDIEHGDEKKFLKKKQAIGSAYQSICGKPRPLKQKDWVTAHCSLFDSVNDFLQAIIDKLSDSQGDLR